MVFCWLYMQLVEGARPCVLVCTPVHPFLAMHARACLLHARACLLVYKPIFFLRRFSQLFPFLFSPGNPSFLRERLASFSSHSSQDSAEDREIEDLSSSR